MPVMPDEVIKYLDPSDGKIIVDCTLGGGGHVEAILNVLTPDPSPIGRGGPVKNVSTSRSRVRVIAVDRDIEAIEAAKNKLSNYDNVQYVHDNFSNIGKIIDNPVDGFLFDLGVSSHQIDEALRGFSIRQDGPLDMRMDTSLNLTAADIVNNYPQEELERIFWEYGEERFSKRISKSIIDNRYSRPIKTTFQLKEIIEKAIPTWRKRESVARIFQALRIAVNGELESLKKALKSAVLKLNPGGRIVVISYHSLEDRIVKRFFKEREIGGILKALTKKPVTAGEEEVSSNPRAKSAKLRCAEKI